MLRLDFSHPQPLFTSQATRHIEAAAAAALPPCTLMERAGQATARLAMAMAPHARTIWLACGSGNNGGDGLQAAAALRAAGRHVVVSCLADDAQQLPPDARQAWLRARHAGVEFASQPPSLGPQDLCVDALLGLGLTAHPRRHPADARLLQWLEALHSGTTPVLSVDLPSGLMADTGQFAPGLTPGGPAIAARYTLALLTLKPGLFTAHGRDAACCVWFDDLGVGNAGTSPAAWLAGAPRPSSRPHASHKGSYGDVAIIGGEGVGPRGMGMTGAALLAASAALHAGAGRVLVALLDGVADATTVTSVQPECMPRRFEALALDGGVTAVAGCGGGIAIAAVLEPILLQAGRLVLDADALNAIATDGAMARLLRARASRTDRATVLTPHPLEAARLLGVETDAVQADRLAAASELAARFHCAVVLKGSGSVIAAKGHTPRINPTGNARLATAGTGDVLAGLLGARLAAVPATLDAAFEAACSACWEHGAAADHWPGSSALTALKLARTLTA
ncbi:NAD(P)H-hydrate dehydratase [Pulveribacter suum]|uniref:Bifunctional NAD(P)H-hydrate repair enzyme n=1 Tax=Pulveribacter suum TaxID=2116657 RepID=A0A2P1NPV1_9BURK|nr:NAD(P)H-hydrate dehydratase [Pulveribacter suum]AVP59070.1 NAD(P)H-hydrate dehydratase [Pulveribacter suum]